MIKPNAPIIPAPGATVRVYRPRQPFPTGRPVHNRRGVVLGPPSAAGLLPVALEYPQGIGGVEHLCFAADELRPARRPKGVAHGA